MRHQLIDNIRESFAAALSCDAVLLKDARCGSAPGVPDREKESIVGSWRNQGFVPSGAATVQQIHSSHAPGLFSGDFAEEIQVDSPAAAAATTTTTTTSSSSSTMPSG